MFKTMFFANLFILLLTPFAQAASFDCTKANTLVEKTICGDRTLSELDKTLAEVYANEVARESESTRVKSAQRNWLIKRDTCTTNSCIEQSYESRLAEMFCDGKTMGSGSGNNSAKCSYYSVQLANRELQPLEELSLKSVLKDSNNPKYLTDTFYAENKAWREYRRASCALYGATEGGLDIWKTAFALGCEFKETQTRIKRLKAELK
jgi:uncharacterized protein YecT (DUF1311 family)